MEQNNFENEVRRKMDELKIPPSDSVWINVEKRITKKKKDKRIAFILFFLIALLLSGGYWLLNSGKIDRQQNRQITNTIKKENPSATRKPDSASSPLINSSGTITLNRASPNVVLKMEEENPINLNDNSIEKKVKLKEKNNSYATDDVNNDRASASLQNKPGKVKVAEIKKENNWNGQNGEGGHQQDIREIQSGIAQVKIDSSNIDSNEIVQNKINNNLFGKDEEKKTVATIDPAAKKIIKKLKKNKWATGFTFSAGTSMLGKNPFRINNRSSSSYLDYNNGTSSDPNSGNGIPSNPGSGNFVPSALNNSVAFMGGIFIEKNISSKDKILLGISYKYFSLLNKVGNRIDSSPQLYFASANNPVNGAHNYRNNFHYLEIPVTVKLKLGNSKSFPLYWDAGINISQLIACNALQFQSAPGLYYNDNTLFNKTQFGLSTGISATLFSKQKIPFTIGPYFLYDISSVADKGLYGKKHFSFIGIKAEILLRKN